MPGVAQTTVSSKNTSTVGDPIAAPRTGSRSPSRNKLKQSASKTSRPLEVAEAIESDLQANSPTAAVTVVETSQPGSHAKRQAATGHEEEVLQLVQEYLPPEDRQMLQQQQQQQDYRPVDTDTLASPKGIATAVRDNHLRRCHSYNNPLFNSRSPKQLDEALVVPVTQLPVSLSLPCRTAQPVTLPELRTALLRSSTAGSLNMKGSHSPLAAANMSQDTATAVGAGGALNPAATAEHPFSTSQPTAAVTASPAAAAPPVSIRPLPSTLLPAVGTSDAVSSDVLAVLGAWYAMYRPDKEAQLQAALMGYYDPKARFEDNFIQAFGREQIGVQFYGMRRLVKGIDLIIEKVEVLSGEEQTTTAAGANRVAGILSTLANKPQSGTYQLRILSRIAFHLPAFIRGPVTSWFLPQAVEAWATDILTVRQADNRIVHHQQRVHNIPVGPWPLRCYLGVTTSLFMMHVLGW